MRVHIYIDGFNLYMARLKTRRDLRWLDVARFADLALRRNRIDAAASAVHFYTAHVSGRVDPEAVSRQHAYLAALKTTERVVIHPGNFVISERWVRIVHPPVTRPDGIRLQEPYPHYIKAWISQEKGSDVTLGAHLLRDAFTDRFDLAVVVTSDTDLTEPIRIVAKDLRKRVAVMPTGRFDQGRKAMVPASLARSATEIFHLHDADLADAQFPDLIVRPGRKPLLRPEAWQEQAALSTLPGR